VLLVLTHTALPSAGLARLAALVKQDIVKKDLQRHWLAMDVPQVPMLVVGPLLVIYVKQEHFLEQ
jgi:hypothetical protein